MKPARILIVEDDRVVARDIQQQLSRIGYSVIGVASRADDAVAQAVATRPDLVVMDVRLEGLGDGIEAAQRIRELCRVPIVYLTAYADDDTLRRASITEPFGYLLKPFEDSQLRTAIELALYKHSAERQLHESESRYAVTLSSIGDAVIATDDKLAVTFMNPAAEALTGWSTKEAAGKPLAEVFQVGPSERGAATSDPGAAVLRARAVVALADHTLVARDGRELPIAASGSPIIGDRGQLSGVVLVFRDVSERKQAERAEALRLVNERVELALRGSQVAIWDFDMPDGDITNARLHTVNSLAPLGYDGEVASDLAQHADNWHPEDRPRVLAAIEAHLRGETAEFHTEIRMRHRDGKYRPRAYRGVAVRDPSGKPIRFVGASADLTDRKLAEDALRASEAALRASEARFRGTFDNAGVGIAHADLDGRHILVNQKYCDIVGYGAGELSSMTFRQLTYPEDAALAAEQNDALLRGELKTYTAELRCIGRSGQVVWVNATSSLQRDEAGQPRHVITVLQDISERKRLEGEFQSAKAAAEAGNRAKDDFLANVSHEIRTPMNAILGMTELVLDTQLGEDQRQLLKTVESAAGSLLGIINDLLDFSKIEAGKLDLDASAFFLRASVSETLRALATRAHRKGLELVCNVSPDVPDALIGDAGRLRQVLINLVGNAIKFTTEGEIVVQVDALTAAGAGDISLVFSVRDTGIGIAKDKQQAIFHAFEQEDSSTTKRYGGTGLGLTIAARLIALMGGEISVDSAPQMGSTFSFTARFGKQADPPVSDHARPPIMLRGLRVLVVDDNAVNRDILWTWLRSWQMEPTAVADGVAAMDALWHGVASGAPYAIALLDARMPDTDGLSLAAKIRERAELAATRLILLTSGDRPGDLARFRELRIDGHLLKPVPQDELLERIHTIMNRGGAEPAAAARASPVPITGEASASGREPLSVLVAEDNEFNLQLVHQLLARRGHAVQLAGDGRDALAKLRASHFDLMLLDLHMPEMDGFELIKVIRESERERGGDVRLPVIALTARSRPEDRERVLLAGMDDFLPKPIQAATLWAAIDRVMDGRPGGARPPLIDPGVLLGACGGDGAILQGICRIFRARVPIDMGLVERAFAEGNATRLRETAHKLASMLSAFSAVAGKLASDIEDHAERGQLDEAGPMVEKLSQMTRELDAAVARVTLPALKRWAAAAS